MNLAQPPFWVYKKILAATTASDRLIQFIRDSVQQMVCGFSFGDLQTEIGTDLDAIVPAATQSGINWENSAQINLATLVVQLRQALDGQTPKVQITTLRAYLGTHIIGPVMKAMEAKLQRRVTSAVETAKTTIQERLKTAETWFSGRFAEFKRLLQDKDGDPDAIFAFLRRQTVGHGEVYETPLGQTMKVYADDTATAQALFLVEFIILDVLQSNGSTHTVNSHVGKEMTRRMEHAEETQVKINGGNPEHWLALNGGSGSTRAIEWAQKLLGTYIPPVTLDRITSSFDITREALKDKLREAGQLPVVFVVKDHEHNANLLSWQTQLCDVVEIDVDDDGRLDPDNLRSQIDAHQNQPIIGSFNAVANKNGTQQDIREIARVLKTHNTNDDSKPRVVLIDAAALAPHDKLPLDCPHIDGCAMSGHKRLGGPQGPGTFYVRRALIGKECTHTAGGTIFHVTPAGYTMQKSDGDPIPTISPAHQHSEIERAGTPPIIGILRNALVEQLFNMIGSALLQAQEHKLATQFEDAVRDHTVPLGQPPESFESGPKFAFSGGLSHDHRVPIEAFVIYTSPGKMLHSRLVTAMLNLFGIQSRAGFFCVGSGQHHDLGISEELAAKQWDVLDKGGDGFRMGLTRLNLSAFMTEHTVDYISQAMHFIRTHWQKLVPLFEWNPSSSHWVYKGATPPEAIPFDLSSYVYGDSQTGTSCIPDDQQPEFFRLKMAAMQEWVQGLTDCYECHTFSDWEGDSALVDWFEVHTGNVTPGIERFSPAPARNAALQAPRTTGHDDGESDDPAASFERISSGASSGEGGGDVEHTD